MAILTRQVALEVLQHFNNYILTTQVAVEVLAPPISWVSTNQVALEVLAPQAIPVVTNQVALEVLQSQPASTNPVQTNQVALEVLAASNILAKITVQGNTSGLFYSTLNIVPQVVPTAGLGNTSILLSAGFSGTSQTLTIDGEWAQWNALLGPFTIQFSSGAVINTLYLYPTSTTTVDVFASSELLDPMTAGDLF